MREETWYSAAEAVEAGLADTIDTATKAQLANDNIVNRFPNWEDSKHSGPSRKRMEEPWPQSRSPA